MFTRFICLALLACSFTALSASPASRTSPGLSPAAAPNTHTSTEVKGSIVGTIIDATDGNPVAYATISVFEGELLVNGTITDDAGKFEVEGLKNGTYRLSISFIGYESITKDGVVVKGGATDIGTLKLGSSAEMLEEVVVTGQRALIEEKVDRLVYNAEQDQLSRGGDAADVLRKVPLLQVDLDGNVSLRGNSNIRVLINNKPSTIIAGSVADAMKMIPADEIKTVEVITSPSAKYDAEGAGGIINIITKKNNLEGYFLNVDTGFGVRGSNLGLNGSYRTGKFGMTLGGFGRAFYNDAETSLEQVFVNSRSSQLGTAADNGVFGRFNLGLDYDISKTQFLSGGVRYGVRDFARDQLQTTNVFNDQELVATFLRDINSDRSSGNYDFNLDYLQILAPGRELSLSTLYSTTADVSNFTSANLDGEATVLNQLRNLNDNANNELTFQADYVHPVGDKQIIEVGAKAIMREVNSEFSYLSANASGNFALDPSRPAGLLDYGQDILAAYAAYTLALPADVTFKAGLRYEQTTLEATQNGEAIDLPTTPTSCPA